MRWGEVLSKVARVVLRRVPAAAVVEVVEEIVVDVVDDMRDEPTMPLSSKEVAHIRDQVQSATKGRK